MTEGTPRPCLESAGALKVGFDAPPMHQVAAGEAYHGARGLRECVVTHGTVPLIDHVPFPFVSVWTERQCTLVHPVHARNKMNEAAFMIVSPSSRAQGLTGIAHKGADQ